MWTYLANASDNEQYLDCPALGHLSPSLADLENIDRKSGHQIVLGESIIPSCSKERVMFQRSIGNDSIHLISSGYKCKKAPGYFAEKLMKEVFVQRMQIRSNQALRGASDCVTLPMLPLQCRVPCTLPLR